MHATFYAMIAAYADLRLWAMSSRRLWENFNGTPLRFGNKKVAVPYTTAASPTFVNAIKKSVGSTKTMGGNGTGTRRV